MKVTRNKVEAGVAVVGSIVLGATTYWIVTPVALGGWGYWRYKRWRKNSKN
tara:strand:+ start:866 stop:1018 length:153 start_codon:yes stop_codon:yes gene_type:complete